MPFAIISVPIVSLTPKDVFPFVNTSNLSIIVDFNTDVSLSNCSSSSNRVDLSAALEERLFCALEYKRRSITTPDKEGFALRDASFTSPALSPKIARNNFSSGVGSLSPLGVILPIKISPGTTRAPIRIIPFSSKSFVASSLTLGMSLVNSSTPRLVSRTSKENSST